MSAVRDPIERLRDANPVPDAQLLIAPERTMHPSVAAGEPRENPTTVSSGHRRRARMAASGAAAVAILVVGVALALRMQPAPSPVTGFAPGALVDQIRAVNAGDFDGWMATWSDDADIPTWFFGAVSAVEGEDRLRADFEFFAIWRRQLSLECDPLGRVTIRCDVTATFDFPVPGTERREVYDFVVNGDRVGALLVAAGDAEDPWVDLGSDGAYAEWIRENTDLHDRVFIGPEGIELALDGGISYPGEVYNWIPTDEAARMHLDLVGEWLSVTDGN